MKLDKNELHKLSHDDLKRVRRYVRYKLILHRITSLHPKQLVIPIGILQIVTFAILMTQSVIYTAVANMVIVGIAFLPFALRKPNSMKGVDIKNDRTIYRQ